MRSDRGARMRPPRAADSRSADVRARRWNNGSAFAPPHHAYVDPTLRETRDRVLGVGLITPEITWMPYGQRCPAFYVWAPLSQQVDSVPYSSTDLKSLAIAEEF